MLPVVDAEGASTERQILTGCLGAAGGEPAADADRPGGPRLLRRCARSWASASPRSARCRRWRPRALRARRVLLASLLYLPALLALLAFDKAMSVHRGATSIDGTGARSAILLGIVAALAVPSFLVGIRW